MSASTSGVGVNSASASSHGYSGGGAVKSSSSGDVVANKSRVVGVGGQGEASDVDRIGGAAGDNAKGSKRRAMGREIMPKNVPDKISKRNPPNFEDTHGRKGKVKTSGASLARVNEADRNPDVQPAKRNVLERSAPKIQIETRLTHNRVTAKQKMCTFGSHRRSQNWTHGYKQQTKGPFSDHMPFKQRHTMTPGGVGSNLGI